MDTEEIENIASIIYDRHVVEHEDLVVDQTYPAIEYLHCSCCSTTIPMNGDAMTAPEMVSILQAVVRRFNAKIAELSNADDFTRKAINK